MFHLWEKRTETLCLQICYLVFFIDNKNNRERALGFQMEQHEKLILYSKNFNAYEIKLNQVCNA